MENDLIQFIIDTRKKTYASGKKPKISKAKSYFVKKDFFEYQDVYYDQETIFQGQEVLFKNEVPIWSFSYRGIIEGNKNIYETFNVLRKILRKYTSKVRFYSPFDVQLENWKYICNAKGSFDNFLGKEEIYHNKELVYHMNYFGGIIK